MPITAELIKKAAASFTEIIKHESHCRWRFKRLQQKIWIPALGEETFDDRCTEFRFDISSTGRKGNR